MPRLIPGDIVVTGSPQNHKGAAVRTTLRVAAMVFESAHPTGRAQIGGIPRITSNDIIFFELETMLRASIERIIAKLWPVGRGLVGIGLADECR